MNRGRRTIVCVLLSVSSLVVVGCDRELAAEVAVLSGAYLGDVVTVSATEYLLDAIGAERDSDGQTHESGDEHTHDATALHDHEH